nr:O-antigen ligase family protein [Lachnospiraceae bacterium]
MSNNKGKNNNKKVANTAKSNAGNNANKNNTNKNNTNKNNTNRNNTNKNNTSKNNTTGTNSVNKNSSNNKNYGRNKAKNAQPSEKKYSFFALVPIIALLSFIPLIAYNKTYETGLTKYDWYTSHEASTDFFLYWKMVWIIVAVAYMVISVFVLWFFAEEKLFKAKILIPAAVYGVISFISAFTSIDSHYSFSGIFEQFEPVWVLVGYMIMLYYTAMMCQRVNSVERLLKWFVVGITLMVLLGMTQVLKMDFFRTPTGNWYMTHNSDAGLQFNFELGRPYLTVYNPNYIGFYAALVVPVLISLAFAVKTIWKKALYIVLALCSFAILFASQSRAGIVCLVFSLIVMILCARKLIFSNKKTAIGGIVAIAVVIVAFIGVNAASGNVLMTRLKEMFNTADEYHALKSIDTGDGAVTITYNEDVLNVQILADEEGNRYLNFFDASGEQVASENGTITDPRFPFTYSFDPNNVYFGVTIEGIEYKFTNSPSALSSKYTAEDDTSYYYYSGGEVMFKLVPHKETVPFLGTHYHFANMRGFIWART